MQILGLLVASIGLPYFVLSTTGPLMQYWFSRTNPGLSPYRLYALSNVASLLALVSFPFFFESHFTRRAQAILWGWGLVAYVIVCAWGALKLWKTERIGAPGQAQIGLPGEQTKQQPGMGQRSLVPENLAAAPAMVQKLFWLLLPACASVLLLATTNKMCLDVAVIPFLWVLPLAIYLLSFIICFDNPRWYVRFPFTLALVASLAALCWAIFKGTDASLTSQVVLYSIGLFVCCMVCHGELYRLKPEPRYLTAFYLMIAAGGAMGGFFVAVAAPQESHPRADFVVLTVPAPNLANESRLTPAELDAPVAGQTLSTVLKYPEDEESVRRAGLASVVGRID